MSGEEQLPVLAFVAEGGGAAAWSALGRPTALAYGAGEAAERDLRAFLERDLSECDARAIARHVFPADVRTLVVPVTIELTSAGRRTSLELAVTAVVVPIDDGRAADDERRRAWVLLPRLGHAFQVGAKEDLEAVIVEEGRRMAQFLAGDPGRLPALLPSPVERVAPVAVSLQRASAERARRAEARLAAELAAEEVLREIGQRFEPRPVRRVGRDEELRTLSELMDRPRRTGVVLVGREGTGKSALVSAWLSGRARRPLVIATSGARLIAGMSGLGQWEARLERALSAAEELDAVLYFEKLGELFGERSKEHADLPAALLPWIEAGRVRVLGELDPDAYAAAERSDPALLAALTKVALEPGTREEARAILEAREVGDGPRFTKGALATILRLTERYRPYHAFPGKAVELFADVEASVRHAAKFSGPREAIGSGDVVGCFASASGMPPFLLDEETPLELARLGEFFGTAETAVSETLLPRSARFGEFFAARVVGQEEAVSSLVDVLAVVKAALEPPGKPLAALLFVGPTGVGKTEVARALAELLFGSVDRLVRFDMSEFTDPWAADRLIRGTDREDGLLTRKIRAQPFSVVLLDELEKAHPAVFDLLLQILGEGRLSDARGKVAYFNNAIVVMTSNLGTGERAQPLGIGREPRTLGQRYLEAVAAAFRPELVNRFDRIVPFRELTEAEVRRIAELAIERLRRRPGLAAAGVELVVSPAAIDRLAAAGVSRAYGARALRRHLDRALVTPIAARLLELAGKSGKVEVDVEGEGLSFALRAARARPSAGDVACRARAEAEEIVALPAARELAEEIEQLVAALAGGAMTPGTRAARMARLHHVRALDGDLRQAYDALARLELDEVNAALRREPFDPAPVAPARRALFRAVVPVLLDAIPDASRGVFKIEAREGEAGFLLVVEQLLAATTARGGRVELRIPAGANWSSPIPPPAALDALRGTHDARRLLVAVEGPGLGALWSLECGRHAFAGLERGRAEVQVTRLASRVLVCPALLEHPMARATPPVERRRQASEAAIAEWSHDAGAWRVEGRGRTHRYRSPAEYFVDDERLAKTLVELARLDRLDQTTAETELEKSLAEAP